MNLQEYKLKRLEERKNLERSYAKQRNYCLQCLRPKNACFCLHIKPFQTNFEFCLLMHPKEARKERLGTGRLAHLILKNSRIIVGEHFDDNQEVLKIIGDPNYQSLLLYPGRDSCNLSTEKSDKIKSHFSSDKKTIIFILDGTWPCAKSMMRESKILHSLPRISFNSNITSRFDIKHQPAKYCLSTIESIYVVLQELEKHELEKVGDKKENLILLLDKLVEFQIKCACDPSLNHYRRGSRPYKKPSERKDSKKWESRKICFD